VTKPTIVVVGSSNTDMVIKLDRLPRPGETILGGEFLTAAGGKGANQAVAAARAGGRVSFVARVGRDRLGDEAIEGFVRDGIDVSRVTRDPRAATGAALIFVASSGENSIAVASGANARLSPADVGRARSVLARATVVLAQLETPVETVLAAARIARASGAEFILNPAPARSLPDALLRRVTILTPNELEAAHLTGIRVKGTASVGRAAARLIRRGVKAVVVTLGSRGALVADEAGARLVPPFEVAAVDTTAAGDVFNGALAVGLTEGRSLDDAVRFANAAAAISVTRWGAQPSAPSRRAIDRLLRSR
jgi:ribokinase